MEVILTEESRVQEVGQPLLCPLLVKVQSIDIQKMNFKSGAPRNKHVTCIEASNQFLFLGCISGTVYVFSRRDLEFLFIIPFKGGKVCNISCSDNEEDIAVGSVRGIISVFRISSNTLSHEFRSTTPILKHLCTISHHNQNEITEILWSLNGRFLFIGDNQGLISQIDIGNFDEFSTTIPSKVILKLKSRIIQLSFIFPYLAVSTVAGVYLSDIENEQFTRIQLESKVDLKSTGVCLVHMRNSKMKESLLSPLHLIVGEACTGYLHSFDLEGVKISSRLVNLSYISASRPTKLFDPMYSGDPTSLGKSHTKLESFQVLGKLFVTDDGFLVSTCHDNCIYIVETSQMQLVLWSDDFHRINNLKIVSNYMFVGSGSHMSVVSLTQFRLYGEQLLKAGLIDVLKRWIQHSLFALGFYPGHCNDDCENNIQDKKNTNCGCGNRESKILFQKYIGDSIEEDEFSLFVTHHLPFNLKEEEEVKVKVEESHVPNKPPNLFRSPLNNFIEKLRFQLTEFHDLQKKSVHDFAKDISEAIESLARVYEVQTLLPVCYSEQTSKLLTLSEIITSIKNFYKQTNNLLINEDFGTALSETISQKYLGQLVAEYIMKLKYYKPNNFETLKLITPYLPMFFNFTKFANQNFVMEWFLSFYVESDVFYDCVLADAIVLLMPFVSVDLKPQIWNEIAFTGFFSFLIYTNFYNIGSSHEYLISSLFSTSPVDQDYSSEIVSSIYRDLLGSDLFHITRCLHHFVSVIYFTSKLNPSTNNCKETTLELLLSCFPLKHWSDYEIGYKVRVLCDQNTVLLNMLKQACLSDRKSIPVCSCGFPVDVSQQSHGNPISRAQQIMEETILKLLIESYDSKTSQPNAEKLSRSGFQFAMQRSMFETFLSEPLLKNSEDMRIEIVLRTNSCTLLRNLRVTKLTINALLKKRNELLNHMCCTTCGESILHSTRQSISDNCIGIWILYGCRNFEKSFRMLQKSNLNTPGQFSVKFYQLVMNYSEDKRKSPTQDKHVEEISCSPLHCS